MTQAEQRQRAPEDLARAEHQRRVEAHRLDALGAHDEPLGVALGLVVAEAERPVVARRLVGDAACGGAPDGRDRRRVHQRAGRPRRAPPRHVARALDVDLALPRRMPRRNVDHGGRVHDRLAAAHRRAHASAGRARRLRPTRLGDVGEDGARRGRPRQRAHAMAGGHQRAGDVSAEEAGRAGQEHLHRARSLARRKNKRAPASGPTRRGSQTRSFHRFGCYATAVFCAATSGRA